MWQKHDGSDTNRLYKDKNHEAAKVFGGLLVRTPKQQELKISDRVAVYNPEEMDKAVPFDEREEERFKKKAAHYSVRGYRAGYPRCHLQMDKTLLEVYLVLVYSK